MSQIQKDFTGCAGMNYAVVTTAGNIKTGTLVEVSERGSLIMESDTQKRFTVDPKNNVIVEPQNIIGVVEQSKNMDYDSFLGYHEITERFYLALRSVDEQSLIPFIVGEETSNEEETHVDEQGDSKTDLSNIKTLQELSDALGGKKMLTRDGLRVVPIEIKPGAMFPKKNVLVYVIEGVSKIKRGVYLEALRERLQVVS